MICKFCNEEIEDDSVICPACGNMLSAEAIELGDALSDQEMEAFAPEEMPAVESASGDEVFITEEEDKNSELEPKSKSKSWLVPALLVTCVLLLGALVAALLYGTGFEFDFGNRENTVRYKDSYTVKDSVAKRRADSVVATMDGKNLANDELQVYYWIKMYETYDMYSYYGLNYFDVSAPLDEQWYSQADDLTWQQYFIQVALDNWQRYNILCKLAEERDAGTDYSAMYESLRKEYMDSLVSMAAQYGYQNADEMVREDMGASASAEAYVEYMVRYNIGSSYYNNVYESIDPTMEQIEAYFTQNQTYFASNGITKDSGKLVDVRHILLQPENCTKDANGKITECSQEDWDACYAEAEALLAQWQSGEATAESFGELAKANSADTGSKANGGLYSGVSKGQMVTAFDAWIFDESRVSGNVGIVKTEFGYHIIYFAGGEEQWITYARDSYISDQIEDMINTAAARWPMEVNYKKIALSEISSS